MVVSQIPLVGIVDAQLPMIVLHEQHENAPHVGLADLEQLRRCWRRMRDNRDVRTSPISRATTGKTRPPGRPRRDFEALQRPRLRAADMLRRGKSQAEVAHVLGVSPLGVLQVLPPEDLTGHTIAKGA